MSGEFELDVGENGALIQSGIRSSRADSRMFDTQGGLFEGLVLAVYYPEEGDPRLDRSVYITVDVRLLGRKPLYLDRVPLLQLRHGLYDEDLWIPRPCRLNLDGGTLQCDPDAKSKIPPTAEDSCDGDRVLIGFLGNSVASPFAFPIAVTHTRAKNLPAKADGRVRRIRHQGVLFEIDKDGNVTIDASAPAKEELGPSGTEVVNPSGGNVTLKTQATTGVLKLEADVVEVASGATDFLIKGTTFKAAFSTLDPVADVADLSALAPKAAAALAVIIGGLKNTPLSTKAKVG